MKKSVVAFVMLFLSFNAFACFKKSVKGYINYYGNAPFEIPGLVADDGKLYAITVDPKAKISMEDITSLQGNHIQFTGKIDKKSIGGSDSLKDGKFVVSKVKKIPVK